MCLPRQYFGNRDIRLEYACLDCRRIWPGKIIRSVPEVIINVGIAVKCPLLDKLHQVPGHKVEIGSNGPMFGDIAAFDPGNCWHPIVTNEEWQMGVAALVSTPSG